MGTPTLTHQNPMTKKFTLNIDDIKNINLTEMMGHIPSIETQKAMVEAIDQLIAEGKSEQEATKLVFESKNKPH